MHYHTPLFDEGFAGVDVSAGITVGIVGVDLS